MKVFFKLTPTTVLLGAMMAVSSCDVLNQSPPAALSINDAFASADRIDKSALGMYDGLQNAEFYGGRVLIYGDVRADDVDYSAYFAGVSDFSATSASGYAATAWTGGYQTIFSANLFMQNLAAHPGVVTSDVANQYVGEAKFIRAIAMFQLCNLFAQPYNFTNDGSHLGIPIQLNAADATTAFATSQQLPRSTVKDVYAQIEKDLLDAAASLPASSATPTFSSVARATKGAAEAMLMRLYLYKGDYASALTRANNVIGLGVFALNSSPQATFRPPYYTKESIFSVAMNTQDNPNTNNSLGQHYSPTGRADITVNPYAALPSLTADDKRRTTLLITKTSTTTPIYTSKYTTVADWVPVVRYAEVLLTKAEALSQTAGSAPSADALAALNQVRNRSRGAAPAYVLANFATQTDLLTAIRTERRLELAFEGHRLYDLFRYKQGVPARGTVQALPYGDPKLVLPIPLTDTQMNPNLVQNPGY